MNEQDRAAIDECEVILRRLQRSGPLQFSIDVVSKGGTLPEPRFRVINTGDLDMMMPPTTAESSTLADVMDEAFLLWAAD